MKAGQSLGASAARGFTMIELMVVMVVMGVMASLAMPRLMDRRALLERGAFDQVRGMLVYARQLAMTQGRDVCLLASPNQARVVYANAGGCAPGLPVSAPGQNTPYLINMAPGIALGGAALVRFNNRGQPVPAANQALSIGALILTVQLETGMVL